MDSLTWGHQAEWAERLDLRRSEDVWLTVCRILSDYTPVPCEKIRPEMELYGELGLG